MIRYPLASDTVDRADLSALARWLEGDPHLTKGPLTVEFEEAWSAWLHRPHSVFCNSGSSANLLMYAALDARGGLRNRKVVVPAAGWVTTVAPAIQLGFEPILCDADPDTFALDVGQLERIVEREAPAVVVLVQVLGVPAAMAEILRLKERSGFLLLEDTCAAVGSRLGGRRLGTFGDMSSFSFFFGHQMSTVEGGMVSTADPELRDLLLMLRSHGWSKDLDPAAHHRLVQAHGVDDFHRPFVFYHPGYNFRSTDLNAFLGLRQLQRLDETARRRAENHGRYLERLGGRLRFQRPPEDSLVASIHCAALARDGVERRAIVESLDAAGVETRLYTAGNLGRHPFWTSRYPRPPLPVADRLFETGFFLPNNPSLSLAAVDEICDVVLAASAPAAT